MKRILSLMFLMFSIIGNAQVQGNVIDENNLPISFSNVILIHSIDSTLVDGKLTLENGSFEINKPSNGSYRLLVNLLAYNDWYSPVFQINDHKQQVLFENIILKEESTALEEVVLTTNKKVIEQTMEGTTINVQSSIMTKGSNLLQLLERSPGVLLDQRNNSFTLNGKTGTIVMINNKPIRLPPSEIMGMLNGISADNIDKIELLTNPSSKHDAEGNGGIINIILLRNESKDMNGSYSITAGYGYGPKQATSFNLNKNDEKNTFYGSYSFNYDHTFEDWNAIGNTNIPVLGGDTNNHFESNIEHINRNHNLNVGFTSTLSKKSEIGADILFNYSIPHTHRSNYGTYSFTNDPSLKVDIDINNNNKWSNFSSTLFYDFNFGKSNKIITSYDYITYNSTNKTLVKNIYSDSTNNEISPENEIYNEGNKGNNQSKIDVSVFKVDYEKKWNEISFEAGAKFTTSKTTTDGNIEILEDSEYNSDERYDVNSLIKEDISALYSSLNFKVDSTWNFTAGLRYENWNRDFGDPLLDKNFGRFFPTLFIMKKLSNNSSLNLALTKRISRPSYNDLVPSLYYNDPISVFSGNSTLQPAVINTISANLNYKSYNFTLGYSNEANSLSRFQVVQNDLSNLIVISPQNVDYTKSCFLEINAPFRINHWWDFNINSTLSLRKFHIDYTPTSFNHEYANVTFNSSQNFKLTKNISAEISGWYNSTHYNGSIKIEGFGSVNMGLKKEFKNGGSLQFSVADVFKSITIVSHYGSLTTEAYNNSARVVYQPESTNNRIFKLSYFKSFGNNQSKKRVVKSGSEDEKSRIN